MPFELDESFSVVEGGENDRSYYCLANEQATSPYSLEMVSMPAPNTCAAPKYAAQKICMNGNTYVQAGQENKKT